NETRRSNSRRRLGENLFSRPPELGLTPKGVEQRPHGPGRKRKSQGLQRVPGHGQSLIEVTALKKLTSRRSQEPGDLSVFGTQAGEFGRRCRKRPRALYTEARAEASLAQLGSDLPGGFVGRAELEGLLEECGSAVESQALSCTLRRDI